MLTGTWTQRVVRMGSAARSYGAKGTCQSQRTLKERIRAVGDADASRRSRWSGRCLAATVPGAAWKAAEICRSQHGRWRRLERATGGLGHRRDRDRVWIASAGRWIGLWKSFQQGQDSGFGWGWSLGKPECSGEVSAVRSCKEVWQGH